MFILFAFPVAAIARLLKLNNILLVFWLAVIYIPQQNFFGGEWIFGGIESKTVAYLFILWSLYFLLKGNNLKAILLAAPATYWHFLAAGWYGLYLIIYMFLFQRKADRKILYYWAAYAVIQIPLVIYIFTGLMEDRQTVINGINTNFVYTYIRNPQHIGIFKSLDYFWHYHAPKVLKAVIALFIAVKYLRKQTTGPVAAMNRLMIIILIQLLLFVPVAYLDKNGSLMKFYPFRGSVIAMMLFQLIILLMLRDKWIPYLKQKYAAFTGKKKFYLIQMSAIILLTFFVLGQNVVSRIETYKAETPQFNDMENLARILHERSHPDDTFLFLCPQDEISLALPRESRRDCYFYNKYIPTTGKGIYEWYRRSLMGEATYE